VVSREYVRQLETKALAKLRAEFEERGISSEFLSELQQEPPTTEEHYWW
jgi:hypothetical protein